MIEALRQHSDLIRAMNVDAGRIIALSNAPHRNQQQIQRTRNAEGDHYAADYRQRQREQAQHQQGQSQAREARHGIGYRPLQHRDHSVPLGATDGDEPELMLTLWHLQHVHAGRRGVAGQSGLERGNERGGQRRGQQVPLCFAFHRE